LGNVPDRDVDTFPHGGCGRVPAAHSFDPTQRFVTSTHSGLSRSVAFSAVAYAFGVGMLGTTLPTPLYRIYQQQLHFQSLMTTIIYAVYAAGVIAALVVFGRSSDILGRRRVFLAGLGCAAISALVFLFGAGLVSLFIGRVLSGLSAGVFTSTATVTLVELAAAHRQGQASLVATAVNMLGLGCGPLLAGILAAWAPAPLHLPFVANLVLLVPAAIGVWLAPETAAGQRGAKLRPQLPSVPPQARSVFASAAIAVFAAFAVMGLLTAIEPGFLAGVLHRTSPALAGAVVFSMFAGSTLGQVALARFSGPLALPTGCAVLILGLAGVAGALVWSSLALLVAGTAVLGIGHGLIFRNGMAAITQRSPADRRAGAVSSFFVVAYVGISVPVVLVGLATTRWGLRTAGIAFTAAVAVVALAALIIVVALNRRTE
jgi:MFS family permease